MMLILFVYFHTIKSILNFHSVGLILDEARHFHTIKSILNPPHRKHSPQQSPHFHTIKSILNYVLEQNNCKSIYISILLSLF